MSNETKQTALELFIKQLEEIGDLRDCTSLGLIQLNIDKNEYLALKEQAKEMEKEQIAEAYWNGSDGIEDKTSMLKIGEQYYNETYGGNK
jgi:hypothetical protein